MPSFFFHLAFDLDNTKLTFAHPDAIASTTSDEPDKLTSSRPLPQSSTTSLANDYRYDHITVQTVTMHSRAGSCIARHNANPSYNDRVLTNPLPPGPASQTTKARFEPLDASEKEDVGWGVIRLYRDSDETPGLYNAPSATPSKKSRPSTTHHHHHQPLTHRNKPPSSSTTSSSESHPFTDEECTTLCILAVPIYLTPSDFLGFVGEKTRDAVSHFRFVRTERGNRYSVLMKFRNGKRAREWRREWNGRSFDGMEPENIHVVFVKSIVFAGVEAQHKTGSFPDMSLDPFTPAVVAQVPGGTVGTLKGGARSKPAPPPTPSLVELPTCEFYTHILITRMIDRVNC